VDKVAPSRSKKNSRYNIMPKLMMCSSRDFI
jgi:hypothetical protein